MSIVLRTINDRNIDLNSLRKLQNDIYTGTVNLKAPLLKILKNKYHMLFLKEFRKKACYFDQEQPPAEITIILYHDGRFERVRFIHAGSGLYDNEDEDIFVDENDNRVTFKNWFDTRWIEDDFYADLDYLTWLITN